MEQTVGIGQQDLAVRRQRQPPAVTQKQCLAELPFELPDPGRDVGLNPVQASAPRPTRSLRAQRRGRISSDRRSIGVIVISFCELQVSINSLSKIVRQALLSAAAYPRVGRFEMTERDPTLRIALIGLAGLAVAVGIGRFAFTPLLPMMLADGAIAIPGSGLLATLHFVGYLMGALTAASVPVSPRALLPASLTAIGLSTLAMGIAEQFWFWLALRWLAGVASAWVLVLVGTYCVNALAEAGRADRQGWVFSGVGAGIVIAGLGCIALMAGGVSSGNAWLVFGVLVPRHLCRDLDQARPRNSCRADIAERTQCRTDTYRLERRPRLRGRRARLHRSGNLPAVDGERDCDLAMDFRLGDGRSSGAAALLSTLASAALHRRFSERNVWRVSQVAMAVGILLPVVFPHILSIFAAGLCVGGTFMVITMAGLP